MPLVIASFLCGLHEVSVRWSIHIINSVNKPNFRVAKVELDSAVALNVARKLARCVLAFIFTYFREA